jgi:hypothetical protein
VPLRPTQIPHELTLDWTETEPQWEARNWPPFLDLSQHQNGDCTCLHHTCPRHWTCAVTELRVSELLSRSVNLSVTRSVQGASLYGNPSLEENLKTNITNGHCRVDLQPKFVLKISRVQFCTRWPVTQRFIVCISPYRQMLKWRLKITSRKLTSISWRIRYPITQCCIT